MDNDYTLTTQIIKRRRVQTLIQTFFVFYSTNDKLLRKKYKIRYKYVDVRAFITIENTVIMAIIRTTKTETIIKTACFFTLY